MKDKSHRITVEQAVIFQRVANEFMLHTVADILNSIHEETGGKYANVPAFVAEAGKRVETKSRDFLEMFAPVGLDVPAFHATLFICTMASIVCSLNKNIGESLGFCSEQFTAKLDGSVVPAQKRFAGGDN